MINNTAIREELRILVANLIPTANVCWTHKDTPNYLPPWDLVAASKVNAKKYVSMRFLNDMDGHSLYSIAEDYFIHLAPELIELTPS